MQARITLGVVVVKAIFWIIFFGCWSCSNAFFNVCQAKSGRQTMTAVYHDQSYGSDIKTIVVDFGYTFDIPPDIERLEVVDETLGR